MNNYLRFLKKDSCDPLQEVFRRMGMVLIFLIFTHLFTLAQEQLPVTHFRFNDDTGKIQFAIVSDLWGGYRAGVFEDAARKLELLQPQFVMSVGDLIEGKTYDSTLVDQEWGHFDAMVDDLSMPFFYVPGNHDISNPWMEKEWKKRLGRTYYYFIHKNVLFLIIDTQDGGDYHIGTEQIAYFRKVIKDHPDVRWTFIFMHRPVWQGEDGHEEGYEKIEEVFNGSHYTLFSGHQHRYAKIVKNGYDHYVLATTGGGSRLRGEKYGEFDHIMWVTQKDKAPPEIINIKLDGLVMNDVVNNNTFSITNTLTRGNWLVVPEYVVQKKRADTIRALIVFNNPAKYPLTVTGDFSYMNDYSVEPRKMDLVVPPFAEKRQWIIIRSAHDKQMDLSSMTDLNIELTGSYKYDTMVYKLPASKKLILDRGQNIEGKPRIKK